MKLKTAWNVVRSFFSMKPYLKKNATFAMVSEVTSGFCAILLAYLDKWPESLVFMFLCIASIGMGVAFCIVGMHLEKLEKLAMENETVGGV